MTDDQAQFVTDQDLIALRVLHIMMPLVVVLFAGAVAWSYFTGEGIAFGESTADASMVTMLTVVHGTILLSTITLSIIIPHSMTACGKSGDVSPRAIFARIRTAAIVRLAMLESTAVLGLVTCMLGVQVGTMDAQPLYWLNSISTLVLIVSAIVNFPTRESLANQVQRALRR